MIKNQGMMKRNQVKGRPSERAGAARAALALGLPLSCALVLGAAGEVAARANDAVYLCIDANGHKELTDTNKHGCKPLELPNSFNAPKKWDGTVRKSPALAPAVAPSDFPKVGGAQQKARDGERRQILDDELKNEEKKLAELKREFNNGEPERNGADRSSPKYQEKVAQLRESIARAEKNIEALKREIALVK
ncbi:MAG: DUF4124 domain-containing protein [Pseudomonadota bacterium]